VEISLLGAFTSLKIMMFCLIFLFGRCNKFEELLADEEYISIVLEFNVNYTKWLDIMKSVIVVKQN